MLEGYYIYMTNNEKKISQKCCECRLRFEMSTIPEEQYQWEEAGYCSYGCMAAADDRYNWMDRRYKP